MKIEYIIGGIVALALIAGTLFYLSSSPSEMSDSNLERTFTSEEKAVRYPKAPELVSPNGYINTNGKPITLEELRGKKVVLVDFWTYSCINCQRTFPYLREWYEKYKDEGLEIIGVHTPEFAFEKVYANVLNAAEEFELVHPIVLDNEYATWRAFGNNYWPRKYLIDIDGYIVYDHIGEGAYEETERAIQRALAERAERLGMDMPPTDIFQPVGVLEVDATQPRSPEVYFGATRNEFLGNGKQRTVGRQVLKAPATLAKNTLYLDGTWDFDAEYVRNTTSEAKIIYSYTAKNVYFVARADAPIRVKITRDGGQSMGEARGRDVDEEGWITIQTDRLYKLVEDSEYGSHILEIYIEAPGLEAYTFTFG